MHKTSGLRDPAAAFPLPSIRDDARDRREANRAVGISAVGLAATGLTELLLALLTGSVGLLGDAIHNLSDVSTSVVVFLGFRLSRRPPTERYPYGLDRAEDLAGIGIALVIWASAAFAGFESIRKLLEHGHTTDVGAGIAGAALGIIGNQAVARPKPKAEPASPSRSPAVTREDPSLRRDSSWISSITLTSCLFSVSRADSGRVAQS